MDKPEWDSISVRVERIENGFIVTERKEAGYQSADNGRLFFPTMEGVERELTIRLRVAANIVITADSREDL